PRPPGYLPATPRAGSGRGLCRTLLLDLGRLPAEVTQVVELRPAHVATGDHFDLGDVGAVHRERPLHTDSEGNLADGKGLPDATTLTPDHGALENLDSLPGALNNPYVHLERVAGPEVGNISTQRLRVQRVQGVHR